MYFRNGDNSVYREIHVHFTVIPYTFSLFWKPSTLILSMSAKQDGKNYQLNVFQLRSASRYTCREGRGLSGDELEKNQIKSE